jgi:hypothetical protein
VRGKDHEAKLLLTKEKIVADPVVAWYHRDRDTDRPWG